MSTEFSLRLQEAKKVSIASYLKELGINPVTETGSSFLYTSPLRSEGVPSFNVSRVKNTWKDFGTGERGDILDLVIRMDNCSLAVAVDKVLGEQRTAKIPSFTAEKRERKNVEIIGVGEITSPNLISYLSERHIPLKIAERYLKELEIRFPYGKTPDRTNRVLGFPNNSGGYEMRSRSIKISNSPKDVTTICPSADTPVTLVEGFFSFLSHVAWTGVTPVNFLILNSLSFLPQMMGFWNEDTQIISYLDADKAGDKATALLKSKFPLLQDKRYMYKDYNDLNDFICGKKKIKTIKEVIYG